MALVEAKGLTHFSLPANDVEESLRFYTDVLGMTFLLDARREWPLRRSGRRQRHSRRPQGAAPVEELQEHNGSLCHQAFTVSSADFDNALESFMEHGVKIDGEVEWRRTGTFNGRSLYFDDRTGRSPRRSTIQIHLLAQNMRLGGFVVLSAAVASER